MSAGTLLCDWLSTKRGPYFQTTSHILLQDTGRRLELGSKKFVKKMAQNFLGHTYLVITPYVVAVAGAQT
jgi:hypothetical protein